MHPYTQNQVNQMNVATYTPAGGIVAAGVVGAVVTGTIVAAHDLRKVKEGTKERSEVVGHVAKEALGGGLALAAGAAVAKILFRSSGLGITAMLAVGVAAKYAYDSATKTMRTESQAAEKTVKSEKSAAKI